MTEWLVCVDDECTEDWRCVVQSTGEGCWTERTDGSQVCRATQQWRPLKLKHATDSAIDSLDRVAYKDSWTDWFRCTVKIRFRNRIFISGWRRNIFVDFSNKKLSCCCDSRSYCVRRIRYIARPLARIAVVSVSIAYLLIKSFKMKSAVDACQLFSRSLCFVVKRYIMIL